MKLTVPQFTLRGKMSFNVSKNNTTRTGRSNEAPSPDHYCCEKKNSNYYTF